MSTLLGFILLVVLIAWGVGLYKPELLRLPSRKWVSISCFAACLFIGGLQSFLDPTISPASAPSASTSPVRSASVIAATTSQPTVVRSVPTVPKSPVAAPVTPPPTHVPTTLLDVSGEGTKSTQSFTAPGDWNMSYTYDCSSFGHEGNFQIFIKNEDGSFNDLVGANELGSGGSDTDYYHEGGTYYLEVNSECSWHVTVQG